MKKLLLTSVFLIYCLSIYAKQKMNVWIADFITDDKNFKDIQLLQRLKNEFHAQFANSYGSHYTVKTDNTNLKIIKKQGYSDMEVAKETDLIIIGKLLIKHNVPICLEIHFLLLSGNKVSDSRIVSKCEPEVRQLADPYGINIVQKVIQITVKTFPFSQLQIEIYDLLSQTRNEVRGSILPATGKKGISEKPSKPTLNDKQQKDLNNLRKFLNQLIDYEHKYSKEDIKSTLDSIYTDDVELFVYLETKYKYYEKLLLSENSKLGNLRNTYSDSLPKNEKSNNLKQQVESINKMLSYVGILNEILNQIQNIEFTQRDFKYMDKINSYRTTVKGLDNNYKTLRTDISNKLNQLNNED